MIPPFSHSCSGVEVRRYVIWMVSGIVLVSLLTVFIWVAILGMGDAFFDRMPDWMIAAAGLLSN